MRNRSLRIGVAGNLRGAGQWAVGIGGLAAAVALAGCRTGSQYGYAGVPQPAYSQAPYFQKGHEQELKAEADRLREEAQLASYEEESGTAVASDLDTAKR
jgi:hypothetical protein